jgi:hypothetical protein
MEMQFFLFGCFLRCFCDTFPGRLTPFLKVFGEQE